LLKNFSFIEIAIITLFFLARRKNIKNDSEFNAISQQYNEDTKALVEDVLNEILDMLGITPQVWGESNAFHIQNGREDLMMLRASMPNHLK